MDVLYPRRFVSWTFCNWAFGNWMFFNCTFCNWTFCGCMKQPMNGGTRRILLAIEFSHEAKKLLASIFYLTSFRKTLWWTPTCYTKDEGNCVMHTEEQGRQKRIRGDMRQVVFVLTLYDICLTFIVVDTEVTSSTITDTQ